MKTFCFDIDGVIMTITPDNDYNKAKPVSEVVEIINQLYIQGNRILIFTARGSSTGLNWEKTTLDQLSSCGLKYHQLIFGKPAADFYIDDRLISISELKEIIKNSK